MITAERRVDDEFSIEVPEPDNPSPEDLVYFPDVLMSDLGKISEMAGRASGYGYMRIEEYHQFRLLCFETEWFNKVIFEDGR